MNPSKINRQLHADGILLDAKKMLSASTPTPHDPGLPLTAERLRGLVSLAFENMHDVQMSSRTFAALKEFCLLPEKPLANNPWCQIRVFVNDAVPDGEVRPMVDTSFKTVIPRMEFFVNGTTT